MFHDLHEFIQYLILYMATELSEFNGFLLTNTLSQKSGLITIFSNNFFLQNSIMNDLIKFLKQHYDGFLIFKNNKFPTDDLSKIKPFLKPNSIIIINQISNHSDYSEILDLSKNNLIICGFECFASTLNSYQDFLLRFQRITNLDSQFIDNHILGALFCFEEQSTHLTQSILVKS